MKNFVKLLLAGFIVVMTLYNFWNRVKRYYNHPERYVVVTDSILNINPAYGETHTSLLQESPICISDDTLYSLYEKRDSVEFLRDIKGVIKRRLASSKRFVDFVVSRNPPKYLELADSVRDLTIIHHCAFQINHSTYFFILGRKDKQKGLPVYLLSKNIETDSCYTYENIDLEYVSVQDELSFIEGCNSEYPGIVFNNAENAVVFRFERMASSGNTFPVYVQFDGLRFNEVDLSTIMSANQRTNIDVKNVSGVHSLIVR